jgi:glycosyltransferase involved in cell wall biosynthesis
MLRASSRSTRRFGSRSSRVIAAHTWEASAPVVVELCERACRTKSFASRSRVRLTTPPAAPPATPLPERVAIVHDWLTGMRGGEKVLEGLLELFPRAEIFTLLHVPGSVSPAIESRTIHTSFVQRLPGVERRYRSYLPLFPTAVERFDLRGFDLVLSSSHCVAKGARADAPHLSYCHTPMRYVWDQFGAYFGPGRAPLPTRMAARAFAPGLRSWDQRTAARVHRFVANSEHVRERIHRCYGRDATVVYPPVELERFQPAVAREDFYLVVSALAPYKRVDLAIEALRALGRPLVVVGSGPESERLRALARGADVRFTGWASDDEVALLLGRCRALLLPGVEDFGITPVEAQAAGAPVIAYGDGGALETVIKPDENGNGGTGVFFHDLTPKCLARAVERFESLRFEPAVLLANARRFSRERFLREMRLAIADVLAGKPEAELPSANGRGPRQGAGARGRRDPVPFLPVSR